MSRLQFRTLTDDAMIDAFLEQFRCYVNVKLPTSYVRGGEVVGAYDGEDLVGGYMLVTRGPFRSLALVPESIKDSVPVLSGSSATDFVEVNGFWVKEHYRGSAKSADIWLDIRRRVLSSKASHLLLFYNAKAKGLGQMYQDFLKPETIYQGAPVSSGEVATAHAEITVGMVSRLNMRMAVYRGLRSLLARKILAVLANSQSYVSRRS